MMSDLNKADAARNEPNQEFAPSPTSAMAEKFAQFDRHLQPARQFAGGIPRNLPGGITGIAPGLGESSRRISEIFAPIEKIVRQIEGPLQALSANADLSRIAIEFQEQYDAINKVRENSTAPYSSHEL